ncbi:MraY family glycosyltransferase [Granulosicoccus antarcticus]|uniref:Undecaprenyl-phosphate alpha-N-acetylglucosaminyl 1-phosphate transferase n=1 Tax=Granulosicoccus antarcticus IMCC3135 TaxID=1192854 RepID=A0A2Z2NTD7_9GAMM|nr:MraY family glycosyltransferase [Granulosicoccus antarcticus]ASJ74533.1 Undecaprenyl-phosphate alpha-N-acetylglucosaminyl 1-phosphate transferase [Granulosicoccus antarcticus IMCC3135]
MTFDLYMGSGVALGGLFCLALVPVLARFAGSVGLLDKPTERKQHVGNVPVVGGIAIYLSVLVASLALGIEWRVMAPIVFGTGLVLMGVLDDIYIMSARQRLPLQIATALAMVFLGGQSIESVGDLYGSGPVLMTGVVSVIFTIMCVVGVINSINMLDGVDGLSGTIITITVCPLAYYCYKAGDLASFQLMMTMVGALFAFLFYNSRLFRKSAKVFMGDSGSMLFGFFLVWYFIVLTQGPDAVLSPVSAGWIFGLPLADTVSVMMRRLSQKRSPFDADREHLHHRLLEANFSVNGMVLVMALIQVGFILVGILVNEYRVLIPFSFWLFVVLVLAHHFLTPRLLHKRVEAGLVDQG